MFLISGLIISYLAYLLFKENKNKIILDNRKTDSYMDNRGDLAQ